MTSSCQSPSETNKQEQQAMMTKIKRAAPSRAAASKYDGWTFEQLHARRRLLIEQRDAAVFKLKTERRLIQEARAKMLPGETLGEMQARLAKGGAK